MKSIINLIKFINSELFSTFNTISNRQKHKYCFIKLKQAEHYQILYKQNQHKGRYYD